MRRGLDGIYLLFGLRAVFKPRRGLVPLDFGGHSEGETPLPIPNRAVKPLSADGTWWATARESRSPPVLHSKGRPKRRPFLCLAGPALADTIVHVDESLGRIRRHQSAHHGRRASRF